MNLLILILITDFLKIQYMLLVLILFENSNILSLLFLIQFNFNAFINENTCFT